MALHSNITCPNCSNAYYNRSPFPIAWCCEKCGFIYLIDQNLNLKDTNKRKIITKQFITPINIGSKGIYLDVPFEIIGSLRSVNSNSITNEWFMKLENNQYRWLIENSYSYSVYEHEATSIATSLIKEKKVGQTILFNSSEFQIIDISKIIRSEMDGEIPTDSFPEINFFKYELIARKGNTLLTIHVHSKDEIFAYKGRSIDIHELNLSSINSFKDWED